MQQITDFPYADTTRLVVKGSGRFDVKVRVPRWATRGFFVKINGRDQQLKTNVASIFYGPVLLAAEESGPRTDWRHVTLDAGDPGKSIAGNPATLRFSIDGVTLKPFYETYGRHSVYLHVTPK